MTIVCKYAEDFHDIQQCQVDVVDGVLMITLIDEKAKVKIIRTSKVGLGRAGAPAEVAGKINFRQSSKLMLQNCDSQQISAAVVQQVADIFQFEVDMTAQASHKTTIINRGLHRLVLAISLLPTKQVLLVHQDKIEVIDQNFGYIGDDNNKPLARTLMQYEEADNAGFGGDQHASTKKWLISASVIDVNGSKVLLAVDSQMTILLYDVNSLVGGRRDS